MEDLEIDSINKLNFKPAFNFRYVDVIILCIPKNMIDHTVNTFNSYDGNLQFTIELPQNNSISFLDIITDWYQKQTFSGRYLNYFSQHPLCNKIAIIYSLVDRVFKLSDNIFHSKNLSFIKQLLIHNNYPPELIEVHIKKCLKKLRNSCNTTTNKNKTNRFISLPYVKELESFINHFFKQHNTNVVYSTKNKLNNIIKLGKDKTKTCDSVDVVYKINCKDCNASYVG